MIVTLSLFIYSTVLQFCFPYLTGLGRWSGFGASVVVWRDTVKWGSGCWLESGSVLCVGSVWANPPVPGCDFLCCFPLLFPFSCGDSDGRHTRAWGWR